MAGMNKIRIRPNTFSAKFVYAMLVVSLCFSGYLIVSKLTGTYTLDQTEFGEFFKIWDILLMYIVPVLMIIYCWHMYKQYIDFDGERIKIVRGVYRIPKDNKRVFLMFRSGKADHVIESSEFEVSKIDKIAYSKQLGLEPDERNLEGQKQEILIREVAFLLNDGTSARFNAAQFTAKSLNKFFDAVAEKTGKKPLGRLAEELKAGKIDTRRS